MTTLLIIVVVACIVFLIVSTILNSKEDDSAVVIDSIYTSLPNHNATIEDYRKALESYDMSNFIAIDVETTGLDTKSDEIVEIAAVRFINGEVVETFSQLVKPNKDIPLKATKINKITNEMLKNEKSIKEVLPLFFSFTKDFDTIVGHNVKFDMEFIERLSKENKIKCPISIDDTLCTLKLSKAYYTTKDYKLDTVAKYLKIEANPTHRALEDATVCGEVYKNIILSMYKTYKK